MPEWKQYEGEFTLSEFPLERYLAGSDERAVFLTKFGSDRAVIQIVPADRAHAEELVVRWNRAASLPHPNLVRILAAGTSSLASMPVAFLVTEYAEESLADVLRNRPLTAQEVREMVDPVAAALAYLHGKGLVHGNLEPANILAVDDKVKISSDSVSPGDSSADIRGLGSIVLQALTQDGRDPAVESLPDGFREMVRACWHPEPMLRPSAADILSWSRSAEWPAWKKATPEVVVNHPAAKGKSWHYAVVAVFIVFAAAAIAGLVALWPARHVPPVAVNVRPAPPAPVPAAPQERPSPLGEVTPSSIPPRRETPPVRETVAATDEIKRRVLPEIPPKARDTVHGTATVVVRATVDSSGRVTDAKLESGSRYFGNLTVDAVRQWQFAPVEGAAPQAWILRFEITRSDMQVFPNRADRQ